MEAIGGTVVVVPGDPRNLKVTGPADLMIAAALARRLVVTIRVGLGYDVHPFADDDARRSCSAASPSTVAAGLAGHSDADAVCHAVADALLGPAGLPDLGALFPASDDAYRDASSIELLRDVVQRVADRRLVGRERRRRDQRRASRVSRRTSPPWPPTSRRRSTARSSR